MLQDFTNKIKTEFKKRPLFIILEPELNCDPMKDHITPKCILPLYEQKIDLHATEINAQIWMTILQSTEKMCEDYDTKVDLANENIKRKLELDFQETSLKQQQNSLNGALKTRDAQIAHLKKMIENLEAQINTKSSLGPLFEPDMAEQKQGSPRSQQIPTRELRPIVPVPVQEKPKRLSSLVPSQSMPNVLNNSSSFSAPPATVDRATQMDESPFDRSYLDIIREKDTEIARIRQLLNYYESQISKLKQQIQQNQQQKPPSQPSSIKTTLLPIQDKVSQERSRQQKRTQRGIVEFDQFGNQIFEVASQNHNQYFKKLKSTGYSYPIINGRNVVPNQSRTTYISDLGLEYFLDENGSAFCIQDKKKAALTQSLIIDEQIDIQLIERTCANQARHNFGTQKTYYVNCEEKILDQQIDQEGDGGEKFWIDRDTQRVLRQSNGFVTQQICDSVYYIDDVNERYERVNGLYDGVCIYCQRLQNKLVFVDQAGDWWELSPDMRNIKKVKRNFGRSREQVGSPSQVLGRIDMREERGGE